MKTKLTFGLFFILLSTILQAGVKPDIPNAAQLQLMLQKLTVVGNVLYVGAHPDDENTVMLAYLSQGKMVRAAYLSLTRGDGGQNLIGSEQSSELGMIRTQELLAGRDLDHAEQFFTRGVDFGFTKNPEETFKMWGGKEEVLSDVVWVIRRFRPDVIVCRFPTDGRGGHGQHTASAILALEAFTAAADPARFPEQLKLVKVWQAKRIFWNAFSWSNPPSDAEKAAMSSLEIGGYNPLLGLSYLELAGRSDSMHKSQGDGSSEDRGPLINYFSLMAGDPAKTDPFEGIDFTWKRIPGSAELQKILEAAARTFKAQDPAASLPQLLQAKKLMDALPSDTWVDQKREELNRVIQGCAGLWLEAIASEDSGAPGATIKISATAVNRSSFALSLDRVEIISTNTIDETKTPLANNVLTTRTLTFQIPADATPSQPYWLTELPGKRVAEVDDQMLVGQPESPAAFYVKFSITAGAQKLEYKAPVLFRRVDPVRGEAYRRFVIVPEVAANLKSPVVMFPDQSGQKITVTLRSGAGKIDGAAHLDLPDGWKSEPASAPFAFESRNAVTSVEFTVTPSASSASGVFTVVIDAAGKKLSRGWTTIDYPHFPPQSEFPPAQGKLVRVALQKAGANLGYIVGSGDLIPEALRQVGYKVTLLSSEMLASADLSGFDAILTGIRAYNTRADLKTAQPRLLEYVKNGGTLVVQYNTTQELNQDILGPYPIHVGRERVSVEDVPVTILDAANPALNFPNKITQEDFAGWIQERGLNFPDKWDPQYQAILSCNDPGETAKSGGTLIANYGKGKYVYTAFSWFRELPAGVPGAYRLFVNLISHGK